MKIFCILVLALVAGCVAAEPTWNPADAVKEAEQDIRTGHIKFYWAGSIASRPVGVPIEVATPGGKAFWKDRAYLSGDQFRRYVESDLMTREPHPDAKPMGAFSIGRVLDKSEAGGPVARSF